MIQFSSTTWEMLQSFLYKYVFIMYSIICLYVFGVAFFSCLLFQSTSLQVAWFRTTWLYQWLLQTESTDSCFWVVVKFKKASGVLEGQGTLLPAWHCAMHPKRHLASRANIFGNKYIIPTTLLLYHIHRPQRSQLLATTTIHRRLCHAYFIISPGHCIDFGNDILFFKIFQFL